jgi:phage FluMu protein Com
MPTTFACPECQRVLRTAAPLPAGKKIKCPKCGAVFAVPDEEERTATAIRSKNSPLPPRRRPVEDEEDLAEAPRPARRRPVDDDEELPRSRMADDDADEDFEERPRRRKKKKAKSSSVGLIVALAATAGVLLAAFGVTAFIWPGFLRGGSLPDGSGNENLLAFAPANANFAAGANMAAVQQNNPQMQQQLNQARMLLQMQGAPPGLIDVLQETDRIVVAGYITVGPAPTFIAAAVTKTPYDKEKAKKWFGASKEKRVQGKTVFELASPRPGSPPMLLGLANNRVLVVSSLPEQEFGLLLNSGGANPKVLPELLAQVSKVEKSAAWAVFTLDPAMQQQLQMAAMMVPPDQLKSMPELGPLLGAVGKAKGFSMSADYLADKGQRFAIGMTCGSDQDAEQARRAVEDLWTKRAKPFVDMAQLAMAMQGGGAGPAVNLLFNDLRKSFKAQAQGATVTVQVEISGKTAQELEKLQQQMGAAFGPGGFGPGGMPGGFGPGGPPGFPPGGGPPGFVPNPGQPRPPQKR